MTKTPSHFEVMFFLPQLGGGGAEMNAVRLATGLLHAGITPVYVVARGPGSYSEWLPPGVEVIQLDTGAINSSTLRLFRARGPLAEVIELRRPDVLCPVMVTPALAALSAVRLSRYKPATVLSIQNSLCITHEMRKSIRSMAEMRLICERFPTLDGVIALSQGVADDLSRVVPALQDRIAVIPNIGLPLEDQMSIAMGLERIDSQTGCTLLACGRLTKQKDYPTLFRAFALLSGTGVKLKIIGDGEERLTLLQMAARLGISDRVTFLGFQRDPYIHMRQADIFVLSSRWEGFGNVLVEAMAMGTPVVSTDCPHGPAEIITDGANGLLVPPGDPEKLAAALQRLIDDRSLRMRLGFSGQARANDFSYTRVGLNYATYFRAVEATYRARG